MHNKILMVDDDELTCKMVRSVLVRRKYEVDICHNGREAFEHAQAETPALVISDLMMPEMDGFELIRKMRSEPTLTLVPVILLSHKSAAEDRLRGFRSGADDFLPKPFYPEELIARVQRVMEKSEKFNRAFISEITAPAAKASEAPPDLRGDIKNLGLGTLLTMLEMENKSGFLSVEGPNKRARVVLTDGRVAEAQLSEPNLSLEDAEAVYRLLRWRNGSFVFRARDDVKVSDRIRRPTRSLLFEAARRLDEEQR